MRRTSVGYTVAGNRYRASRGHIIMERPEDRERWEWQDQVWQEFGLTAHDIANMENMR